MDQNYSAIKAIAAAAIAAAIWSSPLNAGIFDSEIDFFDEENCPSEGFAEWCKNGSTDKEMDEFPDEENCPSKEFVKSCEPEEFKESEMTPIDSSSPTTT